VSPNRRDDVYTADLLTAPHRRFTKKAAWNLAELDRPPSNGETGIRHAQSENEKYRENSPSGLC